MGAEKTVAVDFDATQSAREKFESALTSFKEIQEKGFTEEIQMLDYMNSDYTSKLQTVLDKFDFTGFSSLIDKYEELISKEENASNELKKQDENLSEQFTQ